MLQNFLSIFHSPISKANTSNYPEMISLWEASVRHTHDFLSDQDIQKYRELIYYKYFDGLRLFCFMEAKSIQGFVGIDKDHVQMLFVHPDRMGVGIGSTLMAHAIKRYGIQTVDVNEQNIRANSFYKKLGFQICERSETDSAGKPFPVLTLRLYG